MALVRIEMSGDVARVHSPYDPDRIDVIKTIPGREWNKGGKFWAIPRGQVRSLAAALEEFGDRVQVVDRPGGDTHAEAVARLEREKQRLQQEIIRLKNAQATSSQSWAEQLLGDLNPDQADRAYKALSRVLHPDVGGDTRLMQQLNAARDLTDRVR